MKPKESPGSESAFPYSYPARGAYYVKGMDVRDWYIGQALKSPVLVEVLRARLHIQEATPEVIQDEAVNVVFEMVDKVLAKRGER